MAEIINGVPIGDLPGIGSVPDDSMLVVEFLGKAYHMPGAVLRQMIQDVLDSMGDSVDDVTEARLTAAIETVLSSGKYNGVSPSVEVLDEEDGTTVIHIIDAFGVKKYPVEVNGARNAVQYVEQSLTDAQKAQARKNIGLDDATGSADNVYVAGLFSAKYADIKAAYEAGKACFITYGALLCTMTVFDEEKAAFVGMLTPHIGMKGILNADGSYSFAYVHSNAVQTVAQNLTDEQKAQVRENIGIEEISNSILVELSGNPTDGYTALLSGEAVTGDELDEMAKNGSHITGVATESLVFQVSNGINGTSYTVPDGTFFTYGNAVVTGNPGFYGTGGVHSFEFRVCLQDYNFAIAYKAVANQDEKVWVSATQATHMVFRLGISQGIPAVLYGTQMLYGNSVPNMNYLYTILAESQLLNRPVFCYQVNMPFYTEDGTEMTPYSGVLFSLKINSAYQYFFEAEHEGYVYRFTVKQNEGYSCTAEPTEVYKKVQSKADGLKASNGALTLLSAGEPIGEEVPLPTGSEPLKVTLSGNDTDGYTADKTVAEINEARNAGRDIYMVGGILTYQLCYLSSSFASFTYTRASGTALEVISVVMMDGVAPVRFQQTIDDSYVKYTAQSLDEEYKLQARSNIGALSAGDVDTVLQQAKDSGRFDGEDGEDGYTPVKGKDYFDGYTPVKGVDYFDGKDGYTPVKGKDYFDGYTPVKGKDYFDGANGKTAYAYAQDGGYTGTEAEFAAKLAETGTGDIYVVSLFSAKYADIKAAYDAGKACFVTYGALLCPLIVLDAEKAEFVGMLTPHIGMKGILYADGTYNFQYVHSNAVQTVEQSLTEEKKAQARTNIGALSTADVDTVLQQAKDSGQFDGKDGEDGYTPVKGKDYFDGYTPVKGKDYFDGANGKTAYAYAQDGGYTGTEAEFATKLASDSEPLKVTLSGNDTDGYTADKTVAEIYAARNAGRDVYMVGGAVTYQLSYLISSFAAFSYTMASRNAIEIISVIMMSGVAPVRFHQTIDDSYVKYTAQSLDEDYKLQARSNIGAVGYTAPANVAGTEQVTAKLYTSNGGSIAFGKEGPNSGTMIRLDQVDGTCRLRFRASDAAGAMVWEQPEQGAQLYVDLGANGSDKHRITFPSSAGTLALTSGNVNTSTMPLGFSSRQTNGNWGNTVGTTVTCWIDSTGGGIDFRRDNPSSGKLSMKLAGRVYVNEGKTPVMGTESANGFWGITSPDGENNVWIRTTTQGIIPYQNGGAGSGHCSLGTSSWYFANAYIDKVYGSNFSGLAAKATADANGNDIASTYANKTVANTFNGEQKMINSTHCPTMNDIASGVGCSLKNARACDNQLIVAEIFAPNTTVTDSKINMSAVAGEIGFYHGGSGSGGQFSGKTQLARITSAGIYEGSTLLSNKYLAKSGGTMTGALNLKNSTWNLAGDDAYFGDNDTAGSFAIKGANGTTNLKMVTYNGTTSGTLSWNGSNFAFSNALNFPGGTLTGNLTVGSAKIQTNGYVIGTWLQTTAGNASSSAMSKVCVQSPDGWIYTRTLDQLRNDMNAASKDEVVTAANGALKVTLSGNDTDGYTVDKTFAEIKTAWQAGRYVYVTNGVIVCNPCYFSASLAAVFSYTRATGDGVEVWSVMVNNLGTKPTVVKKTITA